jgi:hypothetical protein
MTSRDIEIINFKAQEALKVYESYVIFSNTILLVTIVVDVVIMYYFKHGWIFYVALSIGLLALLHLFARTLIPEAYIHGFQSGYEEAKYGHLSKNQLKDLNEIETEIRIGKAIEKKQNKQP